MLKMHDSDTIELKNIDPEDISDVLLKIETSFGFKFEKDELKDVKTFGELCMIIFNKVQGDGINDCTSQQAFYKFRKEISATLNIETKSITPDTNMNDLFPRHIRRQTIAVLDNKLGFKTNLLRPKHWVTLMLIIVLLVSFVGLFLYWQVALAGLCFSFIAFKVSSKLANEFDQNSVRQVVYKITRENYLKVRHTPGTLNKTEIKQIVLDLFSHDLDLDKSVLTNQATFD